jgi:hypothetical protein
MEEGVEQAARAERGRGQLASVRSKAVAAILLMQLLMMR